MRISPFSAVLLVIIVLVVVLFSVEYARFNSLSNHHIATNPITNAGRPQTTQISGLKNITYEYIYKPGAKSPYETIKILGINSIIVNSSKSTAAPGNLFSINILYNGYFGFNSGIYNATAFLEKTMDLYYFGYREKGASNLLVYNNIKNVSDYFKLKNTSMTTPKGLNGTDYLLETAYIEPTQNASGKVWEFCGGIFVDYLNNTDGSSLFNSLSYNMSDVSNSSVLNFVSHNCASVEIE